jgi:Protein of unknown function (DUF2905)
MLKWLLLVAIATIVLSLAGRKLRQFGLGRLPGDIVVKWRGELVTIPITSTIIISLLLSLMARFI